jgi:hypothetical protein
MKFAYSLTIFNVGTDRAVAGSILDVVIGIFY